MSRSGYSEEGSPWDFIKWRGAVASAIRGKRGQDTLKEILATLDAMPVKALAAESLVTEDGEYCTLGVLGASRGIDMSDIEPEDIYYVAEKLNIARALAQEIVFENDENGFYHHETTSERWERMRRWVASNINEVKK